MRILILGAAGQVGSLIKKALREEFTAAELACPEVIEATRAHVDVSDYYALETLINDLKPRWIVNATAYTAVDKAESEPGEAFIINEQVPEKLAMLCASSGIRLFHISTDYVFDGKGSNPFSESDTVNPLGAYGRSKLAGENAIKQHLKRHVILRTAWVFSSGGSNFVKTMLRLAQSRDEVSVVSDQVGSPTSARAIASSIASILRQMNDVNEDDSRWGTYHFAGLPYISWADFAESIFAEALKRELIKHPMAIEHITTDQFPTPAKRPANSRLDCREIETQFGIKADDWQSSLRQVLDELKLGEVQ